MPDMVKSNEGDGRSNHVLQWLDAHASGLIANDAPPLDGEDEQGFVGRLYELCLRELQDFHRQQRDISESRSKVLRECLGRLYLWGEPFGSGGLDKALGQSDELRDNVLERLGHIGKLLLRKSIPSTPSPKAPHRSSKQITELQSVIERGRENVLERLGHIWKLILRKLTPSTPSPKAPYQPSKQIIELKSIIEQGKLIVSGKQDDVQQSGDENDEEYDSGSDGSSDSGSYDTIEDISFTTTCLMELGPSLEQNLQHAETSQNRSPHLTSVPFAVSDPAKIYVSLVQEKFKEAHYKLVERLGEANWQRHRDVRDKIEKTELSPEERTKLGGETSIACSLFRPYSDFHDSGIGTSVPAQTEYAPSHTSFLSSNTEGEHASLRVPKEPSEVGAGKPFQCFLCRCVISNVRNRIDWKMHVFADLRPYICTFPECKDELAQFTTRAAWADHELTEHRYDMTWNCPECSEKFSGTSDWDQHLDEIHQRIFTGPQLHGARITASQMHPRPAETEECPLCRVVLGKPRRTFVKHVARHMEEIALMALPRSIEEDSDGSSDSTDQVSLVSENPGLPATDMVDLPLNTKEEWDKRFKSLIGGTIKDSLNAEGSELQPVESAAEAGGEEKLQPVKSAAEAGGGEKLQPVESAAKTGGGGGLHYSNYTRPRPYGSSRRHWKCSHCGMGGMSTRFDPYCLNSTTCGRRKDYYATEY